MRPARVSERLGRLLTVVPYVVLHPGARLEELSRLFRVPENELAEVAEATAVRGGAQANPRPASAAQIEELLRSVW